MRRLPILLCAALVAGCATSSNRRADGAQGGPAPVAAAHDGLHALAWMQAAEEWRATCRSVFAAATDRIEEIAAEHESWRAMGVDARGPGAAILAAQLDGSNALAPAERGPDRVDEPLAVIVDVDETMLDNTPFQARLIRDRAVYGEENWSAWSREAAARPIPGAVEFARAAQARGVTVFYVTNRKAPLFEATAKNLRDAGFPLPDDASTLLPRDDAKGWTKPKVTRRQRVDATHRVVMLVGDNLGDFIAVDTDKDTVESRDAAAAPFEAWWGERWFMLPNPSYGSWLDAAAKCDAADAHACTAARLRTR